MAFSLWWGGLTFYAAVVLPIASEQFGSTEQGLVTEQVAVWHNGLLTIMTLCVLIDAARLRSGRLAC